MMERYKAWCDKWNNAPEAELQSVMDDLDAVIVAFIGDCEIEGIDTSELRFLLAKFRRFNSWNIREEVAQRFEWIAKRIVGERYREALRQEAQQAASESQNANAPIVETTSIVDDVLRQFVPIFINRVSYADAGEKMDAALSDQDYEAYKASKPGRKITSTKKEHFTKLAKNWVESGGVPENLS